MTTNLVNSGQLPNTTTAAAPVQPLVAQPVAAQPILASQPAVVQQPAQPLPEFEAFNAPDPDDNSLSTPPPQKKALDPAALSETVSILGSALASGGPVDQSQRTADFNLKVMDLFDQFDLRDEAQSALIKELAPQGAKMNRVMPDELPNTFSRVKGPCTYFAIEKDGQKRFVGVASAEPFVIYQTETGKPIKN